LTYIGFEWDSAKSERCKRERGFDFSYAISVFKCPVLLEVPSNRAKDVRFLTIGTIEARIWAVIWSPRNTNRRIIFARIASRKERNAYRALL